jgi:hypothetical protein
MSDRHQVYDDGNLQLYVTAAPQGGVVLHAEGEMLTVEQYRKYLDHFGMLLEEMGKAGVETVFALIPEGEQRGRKFAVMFGMKPISYDPDMKAFLYSLQTGEDDGN